MKNTDNVCMFILHCCSYTNIFETFFCFNFSEINIESTMKKEIIVYSLCIEIQKIMSSRRVTNTNATYTIVHTARAIYKRAKLFPLEWK